MKLVEPGIPPQPDPDSETYDEQYYRCYGGPKEPYERNEAWLSVFSSIVEKLIRSLSPRKVLDAGCALGMLVEAFWDRGIQAARVLMSPLTRSEMSARTCGNTAVSARSQIRLRGLTT